MSSQLFSIRRFNLFEKRYFASRIACIVYILLFGMYIIGGNRSLWATVVPLVFISVFIWQIIFQNNTLNGILGGIMTLLGLYFSLAAWSEFNEFEIINDAARQLLIVGWSGCFAVIILGILMIRSSILNSYDE